jgi:hypothetical protein
MNAEVAFRGLPSFPLVFHEVVDAFIANEFQVFNFTHAIFCPVSFIHSFQYVTRKFGAIKTILPFPLRTSSNPAEKAGFWHVFFCISASMAPVSLPQIPSANPAIHSTGSD